jgi:hypothetical protein
MITLHDINPRSGAALAFRQITSFPAHLCGARPEGVSASEFIPPMTMLEEALFAMIMLEKTRMFLTLGRSCTKLTGGRRGRSLVLGFGAVGGPAFPGEIHEDGQQRAGAE